MGTGSTRMILHKEQSISLDTILVSQLDIGVTTEVSRTFRRHNLEG